VKLNRYVVIARGNLKVWFADRKDGLAIGIESDPINSLWILRLKMGQLQRVCATAAKLKSAVIAGRDLRGVSPVGQITNGANAVEPRIVKRSGALEILRRVVEQQSVISRRFERCVAISNIFTDTGRTRVRALDIVFSEKLLVTANDIALLFPVAKCRCPVVFPGHPEGTPLVHPQLNCVNIPDEGRAVHRGPPDRYHNGFVILLLLLERKVK